MLACCAPPASAPCSLGASPPRLPAPSLPPRSGADVWLQAEGGRWHADEGYEGQIGFEWDRVALHRMLTKIISQPEADNRARRLPRLKASTQGSGGGCRWGWGARCLHASPCGSRKPS